jgi:hypothetical protein
MMFLFYCLSFAILYSAYHWPNLSLFIVLLIVARSLLK